MAFKMKGPSMHKGTASYKMAHKAAATKKAAAYKKHSAYKSGHDKEMTNERWSEMSDATTKRTGKSLNQLVAARKNYEKGSAEYNAIQNEINKSYGVSKRHAQDKKTTVDVDGKMVIKKKGDGDDTKIKTGTSKIAGGEGKTVIKTKDGESKQTRGPKAESTDTGNKDTKTKADDAKKGDSSKKGGRRTRAERQLDRTTRRLDRYAKKTGQSRDQDPDLDDKKFRRLAVKEGDRREKVNKEKESPMAMGHKTKVQSSDKTVPKVKKRVEKTKGESKGKVTKAKVRK